MSDTIPGAFITRKGEGEVFTFLGDRTEVLISDKDTGGAYALIDAVFAPGSGSPPHVHANEDEFFLVIDGEIDFHVDGKVLRAKAGDFVHAYRGTPHFFVNPLDRPSRMQIGILPGHFLNFFREFATPLDAAPQPPDPVKLTEAAARYGVTIFPPA